MSALRRIAPALVIGLVGASEGISLAQRPVRHVGVLVSRPRPPSIEAHKNYGAFLNRLSELGYVEGKNIAVEWRFADGDYSKLPALAEDLVRLKTDVIVATGSESISAAQAATPTIPIVLHGGADVVAQGFVKSLAHPGGHTTGVTLLYREMVQKGYEFLAAIARA